MIKKIKIGTRGSPLALYQAQQTQKALTRLSIESAIVPITTSGDRIQDRRLCEVGGKVLFTKEIEEALLKGEIDVAVHSLKDVETHLPQGLVIGCVLEREDPRDAFISACKTLEDLPKGARLGTASLRRSSQALSVRPDLQITLVRGNVETRLRLLEDGKVDALILAAAGLKRLGKEAVVSHVLSIEQFVPSAGQGAIALECREKDSFILNLLNQMNHTEHFLSIQLERLFLEKI